MNTMPTTSTPSERKERAVTELSYENQQRAGEVLAYYLKELGALGSEGVREEGEKAARNIRAAFEALEKVTSLPASGSTPLAPCEAR
ncbi:hypothetical protein F0A17_01800 [Billgrantia pellis]|uniref:Uncharacterized protein n=1 Tax=Billgrantia pellis TaxID=2606936 RepID=A0A7V7G631_9GAMM|nr:hypothetical protein [Halomonas pellis]KAA0014408.1 hypothetical protein F0A17_01800 [Halomonas pellis]